MNPTTPPEMETLDELEAAHPAKPLPTVMDLRGSNRRKNRRAQEAMVRRAKRQTERDIKSGRAK
jgi:hypothetical protein